MPHVPRPVVLTVGASPAAVQETARRVLGLTADADGALSGPLPDWADAGARQRLETRAVGDDATEVALEIENPTCVPYFQWFLGPFLRRGERRTLRYAGARLEAALEDRPPPPEPRRRSPLLPPVPFAPQAIALLGTVAAIAALANFGGALFGQTADSVTKTFGASNRGLGLALAVSRGGFIIFTGAQAMTRAFANGAFVVAGIAAVEEAPEGARAYALSMLALAYGAGFAIAVVLLPLSDREEQ